jgi:hypothetical protein
MALISYQMQDEYRQDVDFVVKISSRTADKRYGDVEMGEQYRPESETVEQRDQIIQGSVDHDGIVLP